MTRIFNDLVTARGFLHLAEDAAKYADPARQLIRDAGLDAGRDIEGKSNSSAWVQTHLNYMTDLCSRSYAHPTVDATSALDDLGHASRIAFGVSGDSGICLAAAAARMGTIDTRSLSSFPELQIPGSTSATEFVKQFEHQMGAAAAALRSDLSHALGTGDWQNFQPSFPFRAAAALTDFQQLLEAHGMGESSAWRAMNSVRESISEWERNLEDELDNDDEAIRDTEPPSAREEAGGAEEAEQVSNDRLFEQMQYVAKELFLDLPQRVAQLAKRHASWDADHHEEPNPWVKNSLGLLRLLEAHPEVAPELVVLYLSCADLYSAICVAPRGPTNQGQEQISREELLQAATNLFSLQSLLNDLQNR